MVNEFMFIIKNEMKDRQMTIKEVSNISGISYYTLRHWFSGYSSPNLDELASLLSIFGYEINCLKRKAQTIDYTSLLRK